MKKTMTFSLGIFLALLLISSSASALRCKNNIVNSGMRDFQVIQRCGQPYWTERYWSVESFTTNRTTEIERATQYDVWYYNFGPTRFIYQLTFRDGFLQTEKTLGYGVLEIGSNCSSNANYVGYSSGELVARCGVPAIRNQNNEILINRYSRYSRNWNEQQREEWIYDFGDTQFLHALQLINGSVISSELIPR